MSCSHPVHVTLFSPNMPRTNISVSRPESKPSFPYTDVRFLNKSLNLNGVTLYRHLIKKMNSGVFVRWINTIRFDEKIVQTR